MWPYVIGFLSCLAVIGIYYLIAGYCNIFKRLAHLEWKTEFEAGRFDRLDKEVCKKWDINKLVEEVGNHIQLTMKEIK